MRPRDGDAARDPASADKPRQKLVEIPIRVLGAADCDEAWCVPPSTSPLTERAVQFKVPPNAGPGSELKIPVNGSSQVTVGVPAYAGEGDVLRMTQREDGTWRVARLLQSFSFLVPDCALGDVLKVPGPDGRVLSFPVPQGVKATDLVTLKRTEQGWAFDRVGTLPEAGRLPRPTEAVRGPYAELLAVLEARGCMDSVPVGADGTLRVNVPFCGRLNEHAALGEFVAGVLRSRPAIGGADIFATEVCSDYFHDWAIAERWYRENHPRISLRSCVSDLAEDPLPEAGLTIAVHPEATKGGRWFQIIGNVVRSAQKGVCILATFYEVEMETVVNMVRMYMADGTDVQVVENPYYKDRNCSEPSPPMRYLVIVTGGADLVSRPRPRLADA